MVPGQHSYIHEHCSAWALLHEQGQDSPVCKFFGNDKVALAPWAQSDPFTAHSCQANTGSITRKIASAHTNLPDRDQTPHQTWLDTALPANICSRDTAWKSLLERERPPAEPRFLFDLFESLYQSNPKSLSWRGCCCTEKTKSETQEEVRDEVHTQHPKSPRNKGGLGSFNFTVGACNWLSKDQPCYLYKTQNVWMHLARDYTSICATKLLIK